MICVVIARARHKLMITEVQEAAKRGAQLIELRLDYLARAPDLKRLLADRPCPLVATVRRPEDGGRWSSTEQARRMLLRQAIAAGFDWVDIETDIADEIKRYKDVKRIISYHNRFEVPTDLEAIYERMCRQDPDVVKIAVTAQQPSDNLRVLKLMVNAPKPTTSFCMGDIGGASRVLCARYGAAYTYGVFNKEFHVAPGQLSFDELKDVYHYDAVNAETKVYGVIGDPVGHSLSPLIHNAAFRQLGMNCVYLPFRVPRGQLPGFLHDYDRVPLEGYSVTIPHKEAAAALAHERDEWTTLTNSANTLVRRDGNWSAHNTDARSALDSLVAALPTPQQGKPKPLEGRTVLLLGAGGVARSLAYVLPNAGAKVVLAGRTLERAQRLASECGGQAVDWAARDRTPCDIVINCTPVGMHPNVDESPMPAIALKPGLIVMDTIYTPENTLLIKDSRSRNCVVRTGVDMFVRQAAMQFKLFTGQEAPLDLMYKLVKRALSPVVIRGEDDKETR
jgi:3-dehydroquinate dehydratase / shikimate dehydrogenase